MNTLKRVKKSGLVQEIKRAAISFAVPLSVFSLTSIPISALAQPRARISTKVDITRKEERSEKRARAQWKVGLSGLSFASQNREENAQLAELGLGAKLDLKLLSQLEFKARAGLITATGQAQTRFGEKVPENRVALGEASLNFKPFSALTLSAGALDQAVLDMPLLVSARAFPGASEALSFEVGNTQFDLRAQQVIPTSITMTTKTEGSEKNPFLMTQTVQVVIKKVSVFDFGASATLFQFQDLPAAVANESEIGGNTVIANGPLSSRFAFEYSGWTAAFAGRATMNRKLSFSAGTHLLQNTKAPEGFKNGQLSYVESTVAVSGGVKVIPRAELFFNESDSAPAFYNSGDYFHNNRQGFTAGLDAKFDRQNFKIGAKFVDAKLIADSIQQSSREQLILLRFETMYADF